ncbi:hypothetical protein ACFQZZ_01580 [Nocardia sp. GCM10030253]|uniref:hypothetical protein n=1 Tax=Nocardia sp. GCM10030253 TaxID=3273404 RepID=UPI00362A7C02
MDAQSVGDHWRRGLEHELPECGDAAGDAGDSILDGLLAEGFRPERLAGAATGKEPALALVDTGPQLDALTDNGPIANLLLNPVIGRPLWPLLPDAAVRSGLSRVHPRRTNSRADQRWRPSSTPR